MFFNEYSVKIHHIDNKTSKDNPDFLEHPWMWNVPDVFDYYFNRCFDKKTKAVRYKKKLNNLFKEFDLPFVSIMCRYGD